MDLDQELHPIKDDDFQPEDEHSNKTMLKRELRAIALKRLEDSARTVSDFEKVIKEWLQLAVWLPPITLNCVNVLP